MYGLIDMLIVAQAAAAEGTAEQVDKIGDVILKNEGTLAYVLFFALVAVTLALVFVAHRYNQGLERAVKKAHDDCAKLLDEKDKQIQQLEQKVSVDIAMAKAEAAGQLVALVKNCESAHQRHSDILEQLSKIVAGHRQDFQRTYDTHVITNEMLAIHNVEDIKALGKIGAALDAFPGAIELLFRQLFDDFKIVPRQRGTENGT